MIIAAAALFGLTACGDEVPVPVGGTSTGVNFTLKWDAGGEEPLSRSSEPETEPVAFEGGDMQLWLHSRSAAFDDSLRSVPATSSSRSTPVTSDNFGKQFGAFWVKAVHDNGNTYFDNECATPSGSDWAPARNYIWPRTGLDFYAYAPYSESGNGKPTLEDGSNSWGGVDSDGRMSFYYNVRGVGSTEAATLQTDFLVAKDHGTFEENESKAVDVHFRHALAGINFKIREEMEVTLTRISIINVSTGGRCTFDGSVQGSDAFVWEPSSTKANYNQKFSIALRDLYNNATPNAQLAELDINTAKITETTFMLIPQSTADVKLEVEVVDKYGAKHVYRTSLASTGEWKAGRMYTYVISNSVYAWTYVFNVYSKTTNNSTVNIPANEITGPYSVQSFRYRTSQPDVKEILPWKATYNVAANASNIRTMKLADKGSLEATSYTTECTAPEVRTTWDDSENQLRTATQKGTVAEPYDLSTLGGTESQTTANCYVVDAPGNYSLPLIYGNAKKNGTNNTSAYTYTATLTNKLENFYKHSGTITKPEIDGASDAVLVWTDAFNIFHDIKLDSDKKNLLFSVDRQNIQQANAVLAVRNSSGTILWSWHIWITEHDIYGTTYTLDDFSSTSTKYSLMTHNIGWVDAKRVYYLERKTPLTFTQYMTDNTTKSPANTRPLTVYQQGAEYDYKDGGSLYYEWGRKDPMPALKNRSATTPADIRDLQLGDAKYKYTITTGQSKIPNSIQNPNIYYAYGNFPYNWCNSLDKNKIYPNLWDNDSPTTDNRTSKKTVYDPSPRGFKIPPAQAFSIFFTTSSLSSGGQTTTERLNGKVKSATQNYIFIVYSQKSKKGTAIEIIATGQRSDRSTLGGGVGGLWAMGGIYFWTCKSTATAFAQGSTSKAVFAYSLVIRNVLVEETTTEPPWYLTYKFEGAVDMARPVRPIKE